MNSNCQDPKLVGRPRKFEKPADLEKIINKYFKETPFAQWSITGIALVVGSKQLINDYEKRKNFEHIIKTAKLMVENSYELSLREKSKIGDIFALKNFGWRDTQHLEQNINEYLHEDMSGKSIAELKEELNKLEGI